jgi:long-chain acyl-CoA synthetase
MYLTQGLHRALQRHPSKIALHHLGEEGERRLDFMQLADEVGRLAAALRAHGIMHGDRVALLAPNSDLTFHHAGHAELFSLLSPHACGAAGVH